jgi:hypothetical protein
MAKTQQISPGITDAHLNSGIVDAAPTWAKELLGCPAIVQNNQVLVTDTKGNIRRFKRQDILIADESEDEE